LCPSSAPSRQDEAHPRWSKPSEAGGILGPRSHDDGCRSAISVIEAVRKTREVGRRGRWNRARRRDRPGLHSRGRAVHRESRDELATIEICRRYSVPMICGALTPTEVVAAWSAGADVVKIFPCGAVGGASYIKALKRPSLRSRSCPRAACPSRPRGFHQGRIVRPGCGERSHRPQGDRGGGLEHPRHHGFRKGPRVRDGWCRKREPLLSSERRIVAVAGLATAPLPTVPLGASSRGWL
jgi:hypothetical protein